MTDPIQTDPELYSVVFENDRVRVLEYRDVPGACTHPHDHPDSVMVTLSAFRRRLTVGERVVEFDKPAHEISWLPGQTHVGENIGTAPTHVVFIELK